MIIWNAACSRSCIYHPAIASLLDSCVQIVYLELLLVAWFYVCMVGLGMTKLRRCTRLTHARV